MTDSNIIGAFEHVAFPGLGIDDVIAKIDTGAYSGTVHCNYIRLGFRRVNGQRVLKVRPLHDKSKTIEFEDYKTVIVRSSTGHEVRRYIVETEVVIRGKTYSISIGLSNRSDMRKDALIGRRFLGEHHFLVDVQINQDLDTEDGGQS